MSDAAQTANATQTAAASTSTEAAAATQAEATTVLGGQAPADTQGAAAAAGTEAGKEGTTTTTETQAAKPVVPEKYDLKLPEGSQLDPSTVEKVSAFAKEKGLTQDQAQMVLEQRNTAVGEFVTNQQAGLRKMVDGYLTTAKADPEIGGEKAKESFETAKRVVDRYASPEFKKVVNETGLGNHPELIRLLARVGKAMGNDKLVVASAQAAAQPKSIADVFYPKQQQE